MKPFDIGTYIWARTDTHYITFFPHGISWKKFLIIGINRNHCAILVPNNYFGILVDKKLLDTYTIDPQYLGVKIAIINIFCLRYFAKICYNCQFNFDYLEGFDYLEEYNSYNRGFRCWRCEL